MSALEKSKKRELYRLMSAEMMLQKQLTTMMAQKGSAAQGPARRKQMGMMASQLRFIRTELAKENHKCKEN